MKVELRNVASNCTTVRVGEVLLHFSYETVVGFTDLKKGETVLSENIWSRTTGKHLNYFGDKKNRIDHEEFTKKLEEVLKND